MSRVTLRVVRGAAVARETLLRRKALDELEAPPALQASIAAVFGEPLTPDQAVARILSDVRQRGDEAVRDYSRRIDGAELQDLRVPRARIEQAWQQATPAVQEALQLAVARIRAFHERQPRQSWMQWEADGGGLGQIVRPLERVGIYAPNGRAPYPSSLLMAAVPARVAGVEQVVVATPPRGGELNDALLAAAYAAEVDEVYAIGGAQAIGALAYGTATVPRVDKILGPGSIFVVLAKRRVFGTVGIDALPGPTETLLVADESANPAYVAADMLAQAEHDPMASALLISTSEALADAVQAEIDRQLPALARRAIIAESLAGQGGIVLVGDLDTALALANEYAPEHLCLLTRDPWRHVGQVRNAGGVFVGELSSEALGDYVTGPTHVMPTGQTARFSSPLQVWDFVKITSIFGVGPETARQTSAAAATLADLEGLTAHAQAVRIRLDELQENETC
ncbi:MAG: histidinol dehydrogenase [Anaerolineales bacterium]